jgi:hypothetical protein
MSKKLGLIAYYLIIGALLGGYVYFVLSRGISEVATVAVVAAFLALIFIAQKTGIVRIPLGLQIPFITRTPRILAIVKALLCFALATAWVRLMGGLIATGKMRDDWLSGAISVIPLLLLAAAAGMFVVKGIFSTKDK